MNELILEAKRGNKEAYTQLMMMINNDLYKICKTRLSCEDDIEDAIQETMIQTFKNIMNLRDINKFKSWIISILINNCNKIYKKRYKFKLLSFDINEKELKNKADKELCSSNIEKIEEDLDFYDLINKLKYEERIIIILHYSERFTLKEISQILKVNENTIKTRLYRAKEKIRKIKEA